jgi:hypothetical protein
MAYLLSTRLHRSRRTGAVLNAEWPYSSLPRFYAYDVAGPLVARWAERTGEHCRKMRRRRSRTGPHRKPATDRHGVESSFLAEASPRRRRSGSPQKARHCVTCCRQFEVVEVAGFRDGRVGLKSERVR